MNGWIIAAALAILGLTNGATAYFMHSSGKEAGIAKCQAERATNADAAQAQIDQRDTKAAANNTNMLDYLRANIPPIQAKADESAATIVTIYRDRIVRVGDDQCSRPSGVQAELDAARARANGTGAALQASPPAHGAAGTEHQHAG